MLLSINNIGLFYRCTVHIDLYKVRIIHILYTGSAKIKKEKNNYGSKGLTKAEFLMSNWAVDQNCPTALLGVLRLGI